MPSLPSSIVRRSFWFLAAVVSITVAAFALTAHYHGIRAGAGAAMAAGLISSWAAAVLWSRPVTELAHLGHNLSQGNFAATMQPPAGREFQELARVMENMAASLGDLDKVKDDFTHMVAHDLRTPLNAIVSYANSLREERRGPLSDLQKEYLGIITQHADSLGRFVSDMLDLATIKAGRMEYHFEPVSLRLILESPVVLFRELAARQGVRLELAPLEDYLVQADSPKIERVVINLLSNAIKFAPSGTGLVQVNAIPEQDFVRIRITDNGPGITPEDRLRLFEKFVRLSASYQDRAKIDGTGLGLYLVKSIIESHGGTVAVDSAPEGGSTFSFTLCRTA